MHCLPIFLCRPHCSGKTSIIKNLLKDGLILERGCEIGKELFYRRRLDTATQGKQFEREITRMEIARDEKYAKTGGVWEWNPGIPGI